MVCRPPSSRSCASAGTAPLSIASASVSGRAPSATSTTTDMSRECDICAERVLPQSFHISRIGYGQEKERYREGCRVAHSNEARKNADREAFRPGDAREIGRAHV